MIDSPQQPSDAVRWREEIAKHGPIRYLVNTECHADHILGNWFFPTTVVAQEQTREGMLHPALAEDLAQWLRQQGLGDPAAQSREGGPMGRFLARFRETDPEGVRYLEGYELRAASVTFSERMTLHVGSHTFRLLHLPGHTAGQTAVHVPEERTVFTGDNVFNKVMPILQDPNMLFAWLDSLRQIQALDVDHVVPGHGEVGDQSTVSEMLAFWQEVIDAVQRAIDAGWSRDETLAKVSFIDRYPGSAGLEYMAPFWQIRNIGWTYDELMARR
jgi:cyclase